MKVFGIVGTGIMGTDIAQLAAEAGFDVLMYDIDESRSRDAFKKIQSRLNRYVKEGRISADGMGGITSRIKIYNDLKYLAAAEFVIECVVEDLEVKKKVFKNLDAICAGGTVLATNTSSISITAIASATKRPESVIGLHFMIPARVMKLVEIIPGFLTTRETFGLTKNVVKKLGKDFVESRDYPGFMLNRIFIPMINEAIYLLYEDFGTVDSIDKVVKIGLNMPMGPLALADMIGLDVLLAVVEEMYREYADPKYRPCPLLKKYVYAGRLGRKSGKGFYIYND
ncbi:MAG: 3-hydroxyacyl-CoA dehydrogenase NAD-binding domain-containing protein [Spirochaetes bacterium]|jgi:3-hydroxybutyryl-CoA dehydrogenase|nr:3-hydroxyacyl-CoA dehydrogenase NAD-binding domain-containing protein [Spirochaetota bacterium]